MSENRIRVLVVDDEPLAREFLVALLAEHQDIEVVGCSESVTEAVSVIAQCAPDVVFLDVQLRRETGFDVLAAMNDRAMPLVVFVTAYDEHAVRAFEVHALDYLLKPFDGERLTVALERVRANLIAAHAINARLSNAAHSWQSDSGPRYPDRVLITEDGCSRFVAVQEIESLEASHNHVVLHAVGRTHKLRESLNSLEARLDPWRFVRVHRSTMVNIDHVLELQPWFSGDSVLIMKSGKRLRASRRYRGVWDRWKGR